MATATSTATTAHRPRDAGFVSPTGRLLARACIAAGAVVAAAVLLPASLASSLSNDHPALAARVAPWNARAAAGAAAALRTDPRNPEVRALVHKALARDVTAVSAIELRALDLAASGQRAQAERLFDLSNRLSRRSLPTRLWLIQQAVDRGDVAGALANYDIALRTSSEAPPILFPVLAKASADPGLTAPLARTLDRPSDWRLMYLEWALASETNPHALANVLIAMRDGRLITQNDIDQRLIEQLVTVRDYRQALRVKRRFDPKPLPPVADWHFSDPSARYPFGWGLVSDGSMGAERGFVNGTPVLTYRASSARSGQIAAQLLLLPPGRYALAVRTATAASGEAPYWSVACGESDGAQLAKLDQPLAAGSASEVSLVVPSDCAAQWLTLRLRPSTGSEPQSGAIASVSVVRRS